jgi:hypothetical protein
VSEFELQKSQHWGGFPTDLKDLLESTLPRQVGQIICGLLLDENFATEFQSENHVWRLAHGLFNLDHDIIRRAPPACIKFNRNAQPLSKLATSRTILAGPNWAKRAEETFSGGKTPSAFELAGRRAWGWGAEN